MRLLYLFPLSLALIAACGDDARERRPKGTPDAAVAPDVTAGADAGADATSPDPDAAAEDVFAAPDASDASDSGGGEDTFEPDADEGMDLQPGRDTAPGGDTAPGMDAAPGVDAAPGMDVVVVADAGVVIPPCAPGAEGCECSSTATVIPEPFTQENCQTDLLCVPWDLLAGLESSGPNAQLTGPVKTCVRPCLVDGDCGAGRSCRSMGFADTTGAGKICVDRVASFDEWCSGSRLDYERMIDPNIGDGLDELVACEDGLTCQLTGFAGFFNPDESVCVNFCQSDLDCTTYPALPYCNPRALSLTSTSAPFIGVCTDAPHPNGAICGSTDPDKVFRLSTLCDTSPANCGLNADACPLCIPISFDSNTSLTPDRQGVCISPCSASVPCFGGRSCIPNFLATGEGGCSDQCTAAPETCLGSGSLGNGQDCLQLGAGASTWSFCVDRYLPVLTPADVGTNGQISTFGDDCTGDFNNYSFFRCPDSSTCVPLPSGGQCIYGCLPGDVTFGDGFCQTALSSINAVCVQSGPGVGICGD